ncbi:MAG TPA: chemotaxis protein CheW, partial [Polyangiaceae bacterium]|nr:chemotaxis protein CheW [Polyangiaceae bacterium]
FHGEIIAIVDLALRLRMTHALPLVERKLVVVDTGTCALALSVDHVRDPEEIPHTRMRTRAQLGVEDHRPLGDVLVGVVTTERGPLAVLEPKALLSQRLLLALPSLVGKAVEELREVAR